MRVSIAELHVYPVKSCRGLARESVPVTPTGLADDRHWMLVRPNGRFVTQRELPRMALIGTHVDAHGLALDAPGMPTLEVARDAGSGTLPVTVWKFAGRGIDCGDAAGAWATQFLETPLRLVRFDPSLPRACNAEWTQGLTSTTEFADGFPILVISRASLADLNSRLPAPLPMSRFRPNVVIDGVAAYDEDRIHELTVESVTLRMVKPCTRCSITTTDQQLGSRDGAEPLETLKSYRFDKDLRGVTFGQNAIVTRGAGTRLNVGSAFQVAWR